MSTPTNPDEASGSVPTEPTNTEAQSPEATGPDLTDAQPTDPQPATTEASGPDATGADQSPERGTQPTAPVPPAEQPTAQVPQPPQAPAGWLAAEAAAQTAPQAAQQTADLQSGAATSAQGPVDQGYPGAAGASQAYPGSPAPGQEYATGQEYAPGQEYATAGYTAGSPGPYPAGSGGSPPGGWTYPAGSYGYPPYAAAPRTDDRAIWALVASIAGFVLLPIVLHIVGWVLANQSLRTISESRGALRGDGVAKTARVLGIVGVVLYSVGLVLLILFFAIAIPIGLFAASTVDNVEGSGGIDIGNEFIEPSSVAAIDGESFSHTAGEVVYDLTDIDFSDEVVEMSVSLGAGTLLVEVPDDVVVTLDAEVGAGVLTVFGEENDGIEVTRSGEFGDGGEDAGALELDLRVTVGELEVERG